MYKVWATPMTGLWRFESCCSLARPPGWIHKVLLFFFLWMWQQSQWIPLCHEILGTKKAIGAGKGKRPTSTPCWLPEILLPPLHIKLGLMKNFVKALDKTKAGFKCLYENFPRLSEAKFKQGVFVGDHRFTNVLKMILLIISCMEKKRRHGKFFSQ